MANLHNTISTAPLMMQNRIHFTSFYIKPISVLE